MTAELRVDSAVVDSEVGERPGVVVDTVVDVAGVVDVVVEAAAVLDLEVSSAVVKVVSALKVVLMFRFSETFSESTVVEDMFWKFVTLIWVACCVKASGRQQQVSIKHIEFMMSKTFELE